MEKEKLMSLQSENVKAFAIFLLVFELRQFNLFYFAFS